MNYPAFLAALQRYVDADATFQERRADITRDGPEIIKMLRTCGGWSVRKFAAILKVSPSYLSKVERGVEPIGPELARRILEIQGKDT